MIKFNIILAFTPRASNYCLAFSCSHQNLVSVSPPCAQHDRPISIRKYLKTCSIRHPALSAILCTNCQHCATWRKCESVCVTSLHIPTVCRHGVTRVRPSVALSFLPSLFVVQSQRAFLIPLTHFVPFLIIVQSVCIQLAFEKCQWHNNAAVTDTIRSLGLCPSAELTKE